MILNVVIILVWAAVVQFPPYMLFRKCFKLATAFVCRVKRTTKWSTIWIPTASFIRRSVYPRLIGYSQQLQRKRTWCSSESEFGTKVFWRNCPASDSSWIPGFLIKRIIPLRVGEALPWPLTVNVGALRGSLLAFSFCSLTIFHPLLSDTSIPLPITPYFPLFDHIPSHTNINISRGRCVVNVFKLWSFTPEAPTIVAFNASKTPSPLNLWNIIRSLHMSSNLTVLRPTAVITRWIKDLPPKGQRFESHIRSLW